jgi:hypothetical protein
MARIIMLADGREKTTFEDPRPTIHDHGGMLRRNERLQSHRLDAIPKEILFTGICDGGNPHTYRRLAQETDGSRARSTRTPNQFETETSMMPLQTPFRCPDLRICENSN